MIDGLLELWTAVVDLWPRFGGGKGELVRRDSDRGAILSVNGGDVLIQVTTSMMIGSWQPRGSPQERARVFG